MKFFGLIAPSFWLDYRKSHRQTMLRRALPDALDVLVICLEGGLSLTGAFRRVAGELRTAHPLLSDELNIAQREIQLGRSTGEALRQFGEYSTFPRLAPERIVLLGFSQGACLASTAAYRRPMRYGGVIAFSGGLIGPPGTTWDGAGHFAGTPVFFGCSDRDAHVPAARVHESAAAFERLGAAVDRPHLQVVHALDEIAGDEREVAGAADRARHQDQHPVRLAGPDLAAVHAVELLGPGAVGGVRDELVGSRGGRRRDRHAARGHDQGRCQSALHHAFNLRLRFPCSRTAREATSVAG